MVPMYAKVQEMATAGLFMMVTINEIFCGIFHKYSLLIVPSYTPLVTGQSETKVPQRAWHQTSDLSYRYEACLVQSSPSDWREIWCPAQREGFLLFLSHMCAFLFSFPRIHSGWLNWSQFSADIMVPSGPQPDTSMAQVSIVLKLRLSYASP